MSGWRSANPQPSCKNAQRTYRERIFSIFMVTETIQFLPVTTWPTVGSCCADKIYKNHKISILIDWLTQIIQQYAAVWLVNPFRAFMMHLYLPDLWWGLGGGIKTCNILSKLLPLEKFALIPTYICIKSTQKKKKGKPKKIQSFYFEIKIYIF